MAIIARKDSGVNATTLPPIIEGAHGVTLVSTWLILIRESWDFLMSFLQGQDPQSKRAVELNLTLDHETVHFLHGFTTSFAYGYSLALMKLSGEIMAFCRSGQLTANDLRIYRQTYINYQSQLTKTTRSVSAVDLLEAAAVTESFRNTASVVNADTFLTYLQTYFAREDTVYRRVIDIIAGKFGMDAALHLTSRLCFLALNGDDPAVNFWYFVDRLDSWDEQELLSLSTGEISSLFGMDPEGFLLKQFVTLPPEEVHPYLRPYQDYLLTLDSYDRIFEFAGRPSDRWQARPADPKFFMLTPPLVACSGGRGKLIGLATNWSKDQVFQYIDTAALVGACVRLLTDGKPYQCCPHLECPVHKSAICHAWYAVPQNWSQCAFPKRLQVQFGLSADGLMALRTKAGLQG